MLHSRNVDYVLKRPKITFYSLLKYCRALGFWIFDFAHTRSLSLSLTRWLSASIYPVRYRNTIQYYCGLCIITIMNALKLAFMVAALLVCHNNNREPFWVDEKTEIGTYSVHTHTLIEIDRYDRYDREWEENALVLSSIYMSLLSVRLVTECM